MEAPTRGLFRVWLNDSPTHTVPSFGAPQGQALLCICVCVCGGPLFECRLHRAATCVHPCPCPPCLTTSVLLRRSVWLVVSRPLVWFVAAYFLVAPSHTLLSQQPRHCTHEAAGAAAVHPLRRVYPHRVPHGVCVLTVSWLCWLVSFWLLTVFEKLWLHCMPRVPHTPQPQLECLAEHGVCVVRGCMWF